MRRNYEVEHHDDSMALLGDLGDHEYSNPIPQQIHQEGGFHALELLSRDHFVDRSSN